MGGGEVKRFERWVKKVCIQVGCALNWSAPTLVGGLYWPTNKVVAWHGSYNYAH